MLVKALIHKSVSMIVRSGLVICMFRCDQFVNCGGGIVSGPSSDALSVLLR